MDFYTSSDHAIAAELGRRLRALRLRRNITQQALAGAAALSVNAIKGLEAGRGKLATLIAVLRELDALDELNHVLPDPGISPLELARRQGKVRTRARSPRGGGDGPAW